MKHWRNIENIRSASRQVQREDTIGGENCQHKQNARQRNVIYTNETEIQQGGI